MATAETELVILSKPLRIVGERGFWRIVDCNGGYVAETTFKGAAEEIVRAVNERDGLLAEIVRLNTPCPGCGGTGRQSEYHGAGEWEDLDCDECGGSGRKGGVIDHTKDQTA